jgi:hypothetical protein
MNQNARYYRAVKPGDNLLNKILRIATSTLFLLTSFILCNGFLQVIIASLAKFLGYGIKLTYNVVGVVPRDWHYWSKTRVTVVYFTAPVIFIVTGGLLFNFLRTHKTWLTAYRLFVFWLMICSLNLALSHLFFSPLGIRGDGGMGYYQTFAIVATWMGLNSGIMSLVAGISIICSIALGVFCRDEVLRFSYSSKLIQKPFGKNSIVFQLYLLPVAICAYPLIMLCSKDNIFPSAFMFGNLVIIWVGMFIRNFNDASIVRCARGDVLNQFPFIEIILGVSSWFLVYRFFK